MKMLKIFAASAVSQVPEGRNTQHPTPREPGFRKPGTWVFAHAGRQVLFALGYIHSVWSWCTKTPFNHGSAVFSKVPIDKVEFGIEGTGEDNEGRSRRTSPAQHRYGPTHPAPPCTSSMSKSAGVATTQASNATYDVPNATEARAASSSPSATPLRRPRNSVHESV